MEARKSDRFPNSVTGVYCRVCGLSAVACSGTHGVRGNPPLHTASGWTIAGLPDDPPLGATPDDSLEMDPFDTPSTWTSPLALTPRVIEADPLRDFGSSPSASPTVPQVSTNADETLSSTSTAMPSPRKPLSSIRKIGWENPWARRFIAVAILLLGIALAAPFASKGLFLPKPAVTVLITPAQRVMQHVEQVTAILTPGRANDVGARLIRVTTPSTSVKFRSSGKGYTTAVSAQGTLTLTNQVTSWQVVPTGTTYTGRSGMAVITDSPVQVPPANLSANPPTLGMATVQAHTQLGGIRSNIPVRDIDVCCAAGIAVRNLSVFWGGHDGTPYPILQPSDIQAAAKPLQQELTQRATTAVRAQIAGDEHLVEAASCTSDRHTDRGEGAHVDGATVWVAVTCIAEVYNPHQVESQAWVSFQKHPSSDAQINAELHNKYTPTLLDKNIQRAAISDSMRGSITLSVWIQGVWVRHLNPVHLATQLAGKNKSQAGTILSEEGGIEHASFAWQPNGQESFPTDPTRITIQLVPPKLPFPPSSSLSG